MSGEIRPKETQPEAGPVLTAVVYATMLIILGLGLWGVWSVGAFVMRISREGNEAYAPFAEQEARERASAAARQAEPTYSDTAVTAAAMQAVKANLTDPGSAKFRAVRVYRKASGTKAVCGEVNAKNRAGGYNGYERFISAGTVKRTWLDQQVSEFDAAWAQLCTSEQSSTP